MNQIKEDDDDLELKIESTWIEDNVSGFNRVIVIEYYSSDCISSFIEDTLKTVGQALRTRVSEKLKKDIGLAHDKDFIFSVYDNPKMRDGKWNPSPAIGVMRTIIRLRNEEHYAMFKLHYNG